MLRPFFVRRPQLVVAEPPYVAPVPLYSASLAPTYVVRPAGDAAAPSTGLFAALFVGTAALVGASLWWSREKDRAATAPARRRRAR